MTPHYVTSDGATYHCVQNYPGGLTVPVAEQPPPSDTVGIDPRFLVRGESGPPTQYDASEIALQFSGGSYYEAPAPGPSTSTSVWMGYQDNVVLATTAPPLIHMVGNMGATYATSTGTCICGCGGSACIPQRPYEKQRTDLLTDDDLREMILFRRDGRCGYPLVDALGKRYTGLEKRDEKVFVGYKSSISIRLEWLAYEKWTRQIRTLTWRKPPDNINLAKLATEVAKKMVLFFDEMKDKVADPPDDEHRVRPGVVDIEHLELVALKRASKSSYMPYFRLITTPQPQRPS